jgi:hypothetical protein
MFRVINVLLWISRDCFMGWCLYFSYRTTFQVKFASIYLNRCFFKRMILVLSLNKLIQICSRISFLTWRVSIFPYNEKSSWSIMISGINKIRGFNLLNHLILIYIISYLIIHLTIFRIRLNNLQKIAFLELISHSNLLADCF